MSTVMAAQVQDSGGMAMSIPNSVVLLAGGVVTLSLAGLAYYLYQAGGKEDAAVGGIFDERDEAFDNFNAGSYVPESVKETNLQS